MIQVNKFDKNRPTDFMPVVGAIDIYENLGELDGKPFKKYLYTLEFHRRAEYDNYMTRLKE